MKESRSEGMNRQAQERVQRDIRNVNNGGQPRTPEGAARRDQISANKRHRERMAELYRDRVPVSYPSIQQPDYPIIASQPPYGASVGNSAYPAASSSGEPFRWYNPFAWPGKLGELLGRFSTWFIEHVWPFPTIVSLGARLRDAGHKTRTITAVLGACVLAGSIAGPTGQVAWASGQVYFAAVAGSYGILLALGCGAAIGWFLPTIAGGLLFIIALMTGMAVGLGLFAGAIWLLWRMLQAIPTQ